MLFAVFILALMFLAVFIAASSVIVVLLYDPSIPFSRVFDWIAKTAVAVFLLFVMTVAVVSSCSA